MAAKRKTSAQRKRPPSEAQRLRDRAQEFVAHMEANPAQSRVAAADELVVAVYEVAAQLAELKAQKKRGKKA